MFYGHRYCFVVNRLSCVESLLVNSRNSFGHRISEGVNHLFVKFACTDCINFRTCNLVRPLCFCSFFSNTLNHFFPCFNVSV